MRSASAMTFPLSHWDTDASEPKYAARSNPKELLGCLHPRHGEARLMADESCYDAAACLGSFEP